MTRAEDATLYFADGYNCSQAVFTSFGKDHGLTEDQCLKIGCAFGGGMGRQQLTCGAVTGALMVLGIFYGRGASDPASNKETTYRKSLGFCEAFIERNGSVCCKELLGGLIMNDPSDLEKIKEKRLFETVCVKYVKDAVGILEQLVPAGS